MTDATIDIETTAEGDGWTCRVTVAGEGGRSEHRVRVTPDDLERLAPGAGSPDDLVRRSFAFLLEREPRTSVLPAFDLPVIGRYFPEYEETIRG
jgi:hypothetical protein